MKRIITIFCLLVLFYNQGIAQLEFPDPGDTPSRSMGVAKIHLVFIGDTEDPDEGIGPAVKNNEKLYISVFTDIAKALGVRLETTIIDGDNYNKTKIQQTINNITPENNVSTFVIVDGHGFWDPKETDSKHGRILGSIGNSLRSLDEKTFHIEKDIFTPIHERNDSAFLMIIGEYCQATLKFGSPPPKKNHLEFKKEYLSELFHQQVACVYSTSSHGQESWTSGNYGIGLFSFLLGLQDVVKHEKPTWIKVFDKAKKLTHDNCKKAVGQEMTPVYSIFGKNTGVIYQHKKVTPHYNSWGFHY